MSNFTIRASSAPLNGWSIGSGDDIGVPDAGRVLYQERDEGSAAVLYLQGEDTELTLNITSSEGPDVVVDITMTSTTLMKAENALKKAGFKNKLPDLSWFVWLAVGR